MEIIANINAVTVKDSPERRLVALSQYSSCITRIADKIKLLLKRIKMMEKFIAIWLLLLLNIEKNSVAASATAMEDVFVLKNGILMQRKFSPELNTTWFSPIANFKLEVLENDLVTNASKESCILLEQEGSEENTTTVLRFKDISKTAGFDHTHRDHIPARPHCVLDFVVPFHNSTKRATLAGEFCTTEHITGGAAVGDYDGDGLLDVFFSVFDKRSVLYRNLGNGKYKDVTTETRIGPEKYANGAVWIDIDQDGDLDIFITTVGDYRHYLYVNYDGIFREEATERGVSFQFPTKRKLAGMTPNVGDFDNDGYPDIYTSEWILHSQGGRPSASRLMRNLGKVKPGYFEDVTSKAGVDMDNYWARASPLNAGTHTFGASFTDFDNDGLPELLITGDYGESKMFWNNGNMTFRECTRDCGLIGDVDAMGHAIGDLNNDGYLEWFSTAIFDNATNCEVTGCMFGNKGNKLYKNLGDRKFQEIADQAGVRNGRWGWGAAFIDFNNDGYLDIVMANGFDTPSTTVDDTFMKDNMLLFQNYGKDLAGSMEGKMKEVAKEHQMIYKGMGRGLLKYDFDNDGDEDVLVIANVGPPVLFENIAGNRQNWLRIQVVHRCDANKNKLCDSYGARVTVTDPKGRNQTQEIGSSTHFLGQSEIEAHFGLNIYSENLTVRVYWPATKQTVIITDVKSRKTLRIVRPESWASVIKEFQALRNCQKLKLKDVTVKAGSLFRVTLSQDKQSLVLRLHPAVPLHGLGLQTFDYTAELQPGGSITISAKVTIDARLYIRNSTVTSRCPHGRMWVPGMPVPAKTEKRTFNGFSNNMEHLFWGAAMENLRRLVPNNYLDDIAMPAGTCTQEQRRTRTCPYPDELSGYGSIRPPPRLISNELFAQKESVISERGLSDLHVHYGQFFVHDLDFSSPLPRFEFQGILNEVWMQITVPKNDSHFDQDGTGNKYLPFTRSTYNRCTGSYPNGFPREQVNKISSYVDATDVYGTTESRCLQLRAMKDGKMKLDADGLIPKNVMGLANDNPVGRKQSILRVAGDTRANVAPGLLAFHTLFVLEHNRLCDEYKKKYPQANDEEIFQYAHRIVVAEHQAIAFREYLPAILGASSIPPYKGYNSSIDASVSNVFATAAFRFGHSQVNTHIFRFGEDWKTSKHGHILLRESYFHPERIVNEGGIEPVIRGMIKMPAQKIDTLVVDELRNALFPVGRSNGLDLTAMNIQRGRDHGLPDLNTARKLLGLRAYTVFSEITKDAQVSSKLKSLYRDINNIDLWVGGLAEDHIPGSDLGATFHAIFREGVLRIRDGDRFWYERTMSKEEIKMVNNLTLARIIKLNTGIKDVPDNVFFSAKLCKTVVNHECVPRAAASGKNETHKIKKLMEENAILSAASQKSAMALDEANDKSRMLEILCIILGVLALALLIMYAVICIHRRRKRGSNDFKLRRTENGSTTRVVINPHSENDLEKKGNGKQFRNGKTENGRLEMVF